jgi:hypothetical protein
MQPGDVMFRHFFQDQITEPHAPGFELAYQPAITDRSVSWWYPTETSAIAALAEIAAQPRYAAHQLSRGGRYLDVTCEGCSESRYFIRPTKNSSGERIRS